MQIGQFEHIQTTDLNLADLMHSYSEKVTPTKRGAAQEFRRISRLLKERNLMLPPCPWLNRTFLLPSETDASGPAFEPANMIWFCYVTLGI